MDRDGVVNVGVLTLWDAARRLEAGCRIGTLRHPRIRWGGGQHCTLRRPRKAPEVVQLVRLVIESDA